MKIAIIALPWTVLPTDNYTGIETAVYDLTEKLVQAGDEVTLFAPAGTITSASLIEYPHDNSGIDWENAEYDARYYLKDILAKYACARSALLGADIIHNFTLAGEFDNTIPAIHTVFGGPNARLIQHCRNIAAHPGNALVTVSQRQKVLFNELSPDIHFHYTVNKSINIDEVPWSKEKEDYFVFIGYKDQENGLDLARRVSDTAGKRLIAVLQGKLNHEFNDEIKPWLDKKTSNLNLQFVEDLPLKARYDLYQKAKGTFYINQWEEPFGMEMLESLACGTPVIALNKGAAREVIKDGITGFLVETESEMVEAVNKIDQLEPSQCRSSVKDEFSSVKIAEKYRRIYETAIERGSAFTD